MIQRKQTIFLALAAVALLSSFFTSFGAVQALPSGVSALVPGVSALLAAGAVYAIFQFADRARQRSLVLGLQYGALVVLVGVLGIRYLTQDAAASSDPMVWAMAAAPATLAYILFLLARKSIESDIALVRSMDRLR